MAGVLGHFLTSHHFIDVTKNGEFRVTGRRPSGSGGRPAGVLRVRNPNARKTRRQRPSPHTTRERSCRGNGGHLFTCVLELFCSCIESFCCFSRDFIRKSSPSSWLVMQKGTCFSACGRSWCLVLVLWLLPFYLRVSPPSRTETDTGLDQTEAWKFWRVV